MECSTLLSPAVPTETILEVKKKYLNELTKIVDEYETLWPVLRKDIKLCEGIMSRQNKFSQDLELKMKIFNRSRTVMNKKKLTLLNEVQQKKMYLEINEKAVHEAFSILEELSKKFSKNMETVGNMIIDYFCKPKCDNLEPVREFLEKCKADAAVRVKPYGITNYPDMQQLSTSWDNFEAFFEKCIKNASDSVSDDSSVLKTNTSNTDLYTQIEVIDLT